MPTLKIEDELKAEIKHLDELFEKDKNGDIAIEPEAKDELVAMHEKLTKRLKEVQVSCEAIGGSDYTLEEIAKSMGITRERVRQIEQAAIKKIRHPRLGGKIKKYLDM